MSQIHLYLRWICNKFHFSPTTHFLKRIIQFHWMVPRCGCLEHRLKLASKSVPVPWVVGYERFYRKPWLRASNIGMSCRFVKTKIFFVLLIIRFSNILIITIVGHYYYHDHQQIPKTSKNISKHFHHPLGCQSPRLIDFQSTSERLRSETYF